MPSGKVHIHHTSQFHSSKYFLIYVYLVIKSVLQFLPFKAGSVIWVLGHVKSSTWQTHCMCPERVLIELTWNLSQKPTLHLFILRMINQTKPYVMDSVAATWHLSTKERETWTLRSNLCYFSDNRRLGNPQRKKVLCQFLFPLMRFDFISIWSSDSISQLYFVWVYSFSYHSKFTKNQKTKTKTKNLFPILRVPDFSV